MKNFKNFINENISDKDKYEMLKKIMRSVGDYRETRNSVDLENFEIEGDGYCFVLKDLKYRDWKDGSESFLIYYYDMDKDDTEEEIEDGLDRFIFEIIEKVYYQLIKCFSKQIAPLTLDEYFDGKDMGLL